MGSGSESNGRAQQSRSGAGGPTRDSTRSLTGGWTRSWTGWLLARLVRSRPRATPRLALLERITLAPRQSLALVEAEGRRILVATSADGASAFYPLDETARNRAERAAKSPAAHASKSIAAGPARVSW